MKTHSEAKLALEFGVHVSCVKVPEDNLAITILGYMDGRVEIRDSETLHKVLFDHHFEAGDDENDIEDAFWH